MSKVIANTYRHSGASSDAITLDSSGNVTFNGTVTGDNNTIYDDTNLRRDLTTLALQTAVDTNRKAYNLQNSFIDQFEDSTGLGTLTNTARNSGEYVSSITSQMDANTVIMWHCNSSSMVDDSRNGVTGITFHDDAGYSTADKKFGTGSVYFDGTTDYMSTGNLKTATSGGIAVPTTGDFTLDFWAKYSSRAAADRIISLGNDGAPGAAGGSGPAMTFGYSNTNRFNVFNGSSDAHWDGWPSYDTNWNHYALMRDGTTLYAWRNGSYQSSTTIMDGIDIFRNDANIFLGMRSDSGGEDFHGYIDEIRLSNNKRYTASTNFTAPSAAYAATSTANATGTALGAANTASSSRTKVSGVMLYKNVSGSATLGTDLKIYFTCNGGTNWTQAASYTAGADFSTGIKTVYLGETTCTAGTDIRYKAEWANQASGSKETRLEGIGVNY